MAGLGSKLFTDGSVLNAAQVNGYLMDQSIMRFATTVDRDAAFGGVGEPTLAEGMTAYIDDLNVLQTYDGSNWITTTALQTTADVSSGLVYVASGSLSVTTSATNVTGVFSSNYKNYKLLLKVISRTSNPSRFSIRYIVGTTPTTVNYYQSGVGANPAIDAVVYYQRSNNDNQLFFEETGFSASYSFDIFSPNLAQPTSHSGHVLIGQQPYPYMVGGFNSPATQHTGFQLFSNLGTLAMEYQVFGYRD